MQHKRNKTSILLRAQRFTWVTRWPFYFEPSERNKIKILLRLTRVYDIMYVSKISSVFHRHLWPTNRFQLSFLLTSINPTFLIHVCYVRSWSVSLHSSFYFKFIKYVLLCLCTVAVSFVLIIFDMKPYVAASNFRFRSFR